MMWLYLLITVHYPEFLVCKVNVSECFEVTVPGDPEKQNGSLQKLFSWIFDPRISDNCKLASEG